MGSTKFLLVVCLVFVTPMGGAVVVTTPDPAHDILVTRESILIPIDSIDLVGFGPLMAGPATRGASIEMLDVSRRGLEDRAWVQSEHALRIYGYAEVYDDFRSLLFLAVQTDSDPELRSAAILVSRDSGLVELPVTTVYDEVGNSIRWTLRQPVSGALQTRFAFATLIGCDDADTCQPPVPGAGAYDMAPNDLATPVAVVIPPVWWESVLPRDDGSVPAPPVSVASIADLSPV